MGQRVLFHQNQGVAGRVPAKKILLLETRSGNTRECNSLNLFEGDPVHVMKVCRCPMVNPSAFSEAYFRWCVSRTCWNA